MKKVWVAIINHRHGTDSYVAKTEKRIIDRVYQYVEDWWDETGRDGNPNPKDKGAAITEYFEVMADDETYDISEAEILE